VRDWTSGFTHSKQTDVIFIDFAKAFDSIVTSKLLFKLEVYGIIGQFLKWLEGFLTNRLQCVIINLSFSPVSSVTSGMPQGSVSGPLSFLIYINDIDSVGCNNKTLKLFVDDAKLYGHINVASDSQTLQQSPDWLASWEAAIH
jgi:ribonuclease P/MRP protein subunit RPP40